MQRQQKLLSTCLMAGLLAASLLWLCGTSLAQVQNWDRILIDGGGVAEDQQLLCHDVETDAEDVLWSAGMIWNEL